METSPVNCVAQYAAPGCSDHQAVTGRARALARTQILALKPSDHWCSEEERNHISAERGGEGKRQRSCVCVCERRVIRREEEEEEEETGW